MTTSKDAQMEGGALVVHACGVPEDDSRPAVVQVSKDARKGPNAPSLEERREQGTEGTKRLKRQRDTRLCRSAAKPPLSSN